MPTLILPPRYTEDSISLWRAAKELGWKVERLQSWRVPPNTIDSTVIIYGESLFAAIVSESLEISLIEPTFDWLVNLPLKYLKRQIQYKTLGDTPHALKCEGFFCTKPLTSMWLLRDLKASRCKR